MGSYTRSTGQDEAPILSPSINPLRIWWDLTEFLIFHSNLQTTLKFLSYTEILSGQHWTFSYYLSSIQH